MLDKESGSDVPAFRRGDFAILCAIAIFAVFFRLSTLMMIHTGVDEKDYWISAKAIAFGLSYPPLIHRTVRFGVILPVAAAQRLFGEEPNVYYVLPVLNAAIQAGLAFLLGRRVRGRVCGVLAALFLILFPYMVRAGSQVRPEIFSVTYVLAGLLCFLAYLERAEIREEIGEAGQDASGLGALMGACVFFFAAYESTVTNLFFVPGLVIVMLARRRPLREIAIFVGMLAVFFAAETALYAAFTPFKLGQLQVIARSHLEDNESLRAVGLADLFKRYARPYLQLYWQVPFALFAAATAWYAIRRKGRDVAVLAAAAFGFFVCLTFAVKSIRPIVPAEPFINRYFTSVLAPVAVVLAAAAAELGQGVFRRLFQRRGVPSPSLIVVLLGAGALVTAAFFSSSVLPRGMSDYAHSLFKLSDHPLALTGLYRAQVDKAWDEGEPIVSVLGAAGGGALEACRGFFLSLSRYPGGKAPQISEGSAGGTVCLVLLRSGSPDSAPVVLAAIRTPFRLKQIETASVARLQGEAFP